MSCAMVAEGDGRPVSLEGATYAQWIWWFLPKAFQDVRSETEFEYRLVNNPKSR